MAKRPTLAEINGMKKDELRDVIKELLKEPASPQVLLPDSASTQPGNIIAMLQGICDEMKELKTANAALRSEIGELKSQMLALQDNQCRCSSPSPPLQGDGCITSSFADVVRSTVESTMNDAKAKNEVILTGVKEGDDQQFLGDLCNKMNVSSTTYDQMRIGRKNDERNRLLKLTFPTNFDARKFMAKFDQLKSEKAELPNIRMRLGKTKQERDAYIKSKIAAKKLNDESTDANCSFSLRDNGSIWKYVKGDDGKWKRDQGWSYQGNDQ